MIKRSEKIPEFHEWATGGKRVSESFLQNIGDRGRDEGHETLPSWK